MSRLLLAGFFIAVVVAAQFDDGQFMYGHDDTLGTPEYETHQLYHSNRQSRKREDVPIHFGIDELCFTQDTVTTAVNSFRILTNGTRVDIKVCLDYLVDQFSNNSLDFSKFPKLKIFYDETNKRLVSLDNRRLAIAKKACSRPNSNWTYCNTKPEIVWATPLDIECTANNVDGNLVDFTATGQTQTCGQLGYDGNHWTSPSNGSTIGVVAESLSHHDYAQKLSCAPWFNPDGTQNPQYFDNATKLPGIVPENFEQRCRETVLSELPPVSLQVKNPQGTLITVRTFYAPPVVPTSASGENGAMSSLGSNLLAKSLLAAGVVFVFTCI